MKSTSLFYVANTMPIYLYYYYHPLCTTLPKQRYLRPRVLHCTSFAHFHLFQRNSSNDGLKLLPVCGLGLLCPTLPTHSFNMRHPIEGGMLVPVKFIRIFAFLNWGIFIVAPQVPPLPIQCKVSSSDLGRKVLNKRLQLLRKVSNLLGNRVLSTGCKYRELH